MIKSDRLEDKKKLLAFIAYHYLQKVKCVKIKCICISYFVFLMWQRALSINVFFFHNVEYQILYCVTQMKTACPKRRCNMFYRNMEDISYNLLR